MAFIQADHHGVDQSSRNTITHSFRWVVVFVFLIAGIVPSVCRAQLADTPWPTFQRDAQRTGRSPYLGPEEPTVMWRFQLANTSISSIAVGEDGTIYFGDQGGIVYAVNPDGTEKWRFETLATYIWSSGPTIDANGTIYVGTADTDGPDADYLYALNPDGTEKWHLDVGWHVYGAPAIAEDGTIYVGSRDGNLYAVSPDGEVLWLFSTYYIAASPAIGHDGRIYAPTYTGPPNVLFCIDTNGQEVWRVPAGFSYGGSSIGMDGVIYTQTEDDLIATNPDGIPKWNVRFGGYGYGIPCIGADGTIYVATTPGGLYAVSPEGKILWTTPSPDEGDCPIVDPEGTVYVANYAIRADGTIKWILNEGLFYRTRLAMNSNGTLYVIGDSILYAIGPGRGNPGPELTLTGTCPGQMEVTASGATPGGRIAFIRSSFGGCGGQSTIPSGIPCAGTVLPLTLPSLVRIVTADSQGAAHLAGYIPGAVCGNICLIALDIATCQTSNVVKF